MTNRCMKRYSMSLNYQENTSRTIVRYHPVIAKMASMKKKKISAGQDVEKEYFHAFE